MTQSQTTSEPQGQYVQANGLRIYYEEYGRGIPLLLIHSGFNTGRSCWHDVVPALAQHFRVIAPDSRGHGWTDHPTGQMSYRMMADDVAALIQVLGLDRPLVCGHSDGAQVALELAVRYPKLARALVISAGVHQWPDQYFEAMATYFHIDRSGTVNIPYFIEKEPGVIEWIKSLHPTQDPDYWQTYLRICGVWYTAPLNLSAEDLQKITDPTLILSGDRDQLYPLEETCALYKLIAGAELAILPSIAHSDMVGSDNLFIPVLLDFFKRHSA